MSTATTSLGPNQRAFNCPSCKGRIVIPTDLPPTTGPCPHCQATITSPAPAETTAAQPVTQAPAAAPAPVTPKAETPKTAEPVAVQSSPKASEKAKPAPKVAKTKQGSGTGAFLIITILLIATLGWEIFAQTKYRTLHKFIESRAIGKSEIFRVIISTPDQEANSAGQAADFYHFTDPAYPADHLKIKPIAGSQAAEALSRLDMEAKQQNFPAERTATVELEWIGDAQNPQIQIKRLICWEFLGLGGSEIAESN